MNYYHQWSEDNKAKVCVPDLLFINFTRIVVSAALPQAMRSAQNDDHKGHLCEF